LPDLFGANFTGRNHSVNYDSLFIENTAQALSECVVFVVRMAFERRDGASCQDVSELNCPFGF
jgi:hypothetical protein